MNKLIGFSTGCFVEADTAIIQIISMLQSKTNSIELSLATPLELLNFSISDQLVSLLKTFDKVTIHAPWKGIEYARNKLTLDVINKLEEFYNKLDLSGIVIHPDTIDDFDLLEKYDLPFLLENMDKRKEFGIKPEHFSELKKKCSFDYVLDFQHIYEHDSSMLLAKEFLDVMDEKIHHVHVSGCSDSFNHLPVYKSINKNAILNTLVEIKDLPIILEGKIQEKLEEVIDEELKLINSRV